VQYDVSEVHKLSVAFTRLEATEVFSAHSNVGVPLVIGAMRKTRQSILSIPVADAMFMSHAPIWFRFNFLITRSGMIRHTNMPWYLRHILKLKFELVLLWDIRGLAHGVDCYRKQVL
jgi:hypothetical protein